VVFSRFNTKYKGFSGFYSDEFFDDPAQTHYKYENNKAGEAQMSATMKDYSEKRDFHRMRMNSEIELTDSNGVAFAGVCRDLSGTGMQLFVERAFSEGDEIHTLLPSSSDQFPPFETLCRVLRCEQEEEGYLLGVEIVEVKR